MSNSLPPSNTSDDAFQHEESQFFNRASLSSETGHYSAGPETGQYSSVPDVDVDNACQSVSLSNTALRTSSAYLLLQLREGDDSSTSLLQGRDELTENSWATYPSALGGSTNLIQSRMTSSSVIPTQYNMPLEDSLTRLTSGQYAAPVTLRPAMPSAGSNLTGISTDGSTNEGCKCKKSKCLKMYCQCFASKKMCTFFCACHECHNTATFAEERKQIMDSMINRKPNAFEHKIRPQTGALSPQGVLPGTPLAHRNGCKCRKSACLKKYCECFDGGVRCGERCCCLGCKNGGFYREAPLEHPNYPSGSSAWSKKGRTDAIHKHTPAEGDTTVTALGDNIPTPLASAGQHTQATMLQMEKYSLEGLRHELTPDTNTSGYRPSKRTRPSQGIEGMVSSQQNSKSFVAPPVTSLGFSRHMVTSQDLPPFLHGTSGNGASDLEALVGYDGNISMATSLSSSMYNSLQQSGPEHEAVSTNMSNSYFRVDPNFDDNKDHVCDILNDVKILPPERLMVATNSEQNTENILQNEAEPTDESEQEASAFI